MKEAWKLQDAKSRFSEVVDAALREGPQTVTRRGEKAVVVLSHREFVRLSQAETTLDDALSGAPQELSFGRDPAVIPAVTLE
ncbi:type II toxin-antitoxin system prevent-host-death family antitoxin [Deinococcus marmoris]|uniref:Antitoxin n=1 Tax=Deinococcus marmoris TaxID=249408 RepID=A0A1U7NZ56_9DEIO|nr:type II toxin-antitoxin system prevent-host-death family antitoxin [Deinococcus marmoris]OLV18199.1 hypothetical protein BOO71_0006646 [Deinococcus marmoris]